MNDTPTPDLRRALVPATLTALGMVALTGLCSGYPCVTTGLRYGLWLERCPATDLRGAAALNASGLVRGDWGHVDLTIDAQWMSGDDANAYQESARITHQDVVLDLLDEDGAVVPGVELKEPDWSDDRLDVQVKLPEVADGTYTLRATVEAGFETLTVDAELPLFTPALVHLLTDRPLYKPGQDVLLRAAVLARTDATPIEDRPGVWTVTSPDGTRMLEEKARTDAWGVVPTTFPLAVDAEEGIWSATYTTGSDSRTIRFDVRPFELPRFTVELASDQPWYTTSDGISVTGTARYTSGAPVASARVDLDLAHVDGRWPMPLAWEERRTTFTDAQGRFEVDLGEVPADLMETAQIAVTARVTDDTGERRPGSTVLKLSEDDLAVQSVTAFDGGLIQDFNNRAYLRVTTPDGRPLSETDLVVRNPYRPDEPEMRARTDVDGVAAIQLDPGEPVTLVRPAPPARIRPFAPDKPRLSAGRVFPGRASLDLPERRAFDRLHPGIARCGELAVGAQNLRVGIQVAPSGAVTRVLGPDGLLGTCVEDIMRQARLPPGRPRSYDLTWRVPDALLPSLEPNHTSITGKQVEATTALDEAALRARRCFTRGVGIEDAPVLHVHWQMQEGSTALATTLEPRGGTGLPASTTACVQRAFAAVRLAEPAEQAGLGVSSFELHVPQPPGSRRPQALTSTGFQLEVSAMADGTRVGRTTIDFQPGWLPPLRMRVTPSLARAGDTLDIELLRGPDHRGDLPEEVHLADGSKHLTKAKVDPKTRKASLTLPDDAEGFLRLTSGGAASIVFVQPEDALSVVLSTDDDAYTPGETAKLKVVTRAGEAPVQASVTLAGVDQALAELAPLTSPDDWGDVMVRATGRDAFDRFGPRALQLGQVRGENAAKAAVLLVDNLPSDPAGDQPVYASGAVSPPIEETLITTFYSGLEALVAKVRTWEDTAPDDEKLDPPTLAGLWGEVLTEAKASGTPLVDGYGRPLTLGLLPDDLLAQADPRQVVADATRLPEDVVNWTNWVRENQ